MRESIFGACVSGAAYNETKAEEFLSSIRDTSCKDIVEDYFQAKAAGSSFSDWFRNFSFQDGWFGRGPAACIAILIRRLEDIQVSYSNLTGSFVGLPVGLPWKFNEKTKNLSEEEFRSILLRYISYFTDEKVEICLWDLADGCDY